jgi:hypothetical protein
LALGFAWKTIFFYNYKKALMSVYIGGGVDLKFLDLPMTNNG